MPAKRKPGHPSPYEGREVEIAKAIAERLKTGEPLAQILRENCWPSHDALTDWRAKFPEVERIISHARDVGFDAIAADCLAIADDASGDVEDTESGPRVNQENVQRSRLRVDTRLKLLAKWDGKRYGDAVAVTHAGEVKVTREPLDALRSRIRESVPAHGRS